MFLEPGRCALADLKCSLGGPWGPHSWAVEGGTAGMLPLCTEPALVSLLWVGALPFVAVLAALSARSCDFHLGSQRVWDHAFLN